MDQHRNLMKFGLQTSQVGTFERECCGGASLSVTRTVQKLQGAKFIYVTYLTQIPNKCIWSIFKSFEPMHVNMSGALFLFCSMVVLTVPHRLWGANFLNQRGIWCKYIYIYVYIHPILVPAPLEIYIIYIHHFDWDTGHVANGTKKFITPHSQLQVLFFQENFLNLRFAETFAQSLAPNLWETKPIWGFP